MHTVRYMMGSECTKRGSRCGFLYFLRLCEAGFKRDQAQSTHTPHTSTPPGRVRRSKATQAKRNITQTPGDCDKPFHEIKLKFIDQI